MPRKLLARPRSDVSFAWAKADASLDGWREPLAEWAAQHTNRAIAIDLGNKVLDGLRVAAEFAPNPEVFCRRASAADHAAFLQWMNSAGRAWKSKLRNTARAFFAWYLQAHLSASDDNGSLTVSADYCNPVPRARGGAVSTETARNAMPTRFLRDLLEILTEDDWAWPRRQTEDYVEVVDAETGGKLQVWCPVRASVVALKLLLPLRTFQVRFVESSEGDDTRYRDGRWEANPGAGAPANGAVRRRGFLHRIEDGATGTSGMGFYVNTNKTADAQQRANEQGYVIPWENRRAIAIVEQLEIWQARYNPIDEPLAWASLRDLQVCNTAPRSGRAFFLMRDPGGTYWNEPVSDGRVRLLWNLLVAELERRMAARGETMANGEAVVLTRPSARPNRPQSRYDLHTLRVSILTALAVDGGLPLHVLSKCVAGHASIVMTMYYVKVSREAMSEQIEAATARIDAREQERFAQYLKSEARSEGGFVSNDPVGVAAVDHGDVASWLTLETGICPVGATRCHDGGPLLAKGVHGPVPGGARNCARCRFHITGPAFLGGLVFKFNATSFNLGAAARECEAARVELRETEDRRAATECRGEAFDGRAVDRVRERLDRAQARVSSAVGTLQALALLVHRTRAVMDKPTGGLHLVAVGKERDLRVAIKTTSDIDLADRVCQAAEIYPSPEATEASLRRSQAIDRMVLRHGHAPVMLQLSETEALRAGNEMIRLMSAQLGRDNAMQVLGGGEHLVDGVASLVGDWLSGRTPMRSVLDGAAPPPSIEHKP